MPPESAVFVAATAVTVLGAVTGSHALQLAGKPLLAPSLAVRAWRARREPVDSALVLAGLAAATVGDCYLIEPDDDRRMLRGAGWFTAMQLSYSGYWLRRGARPTAFAAVPRLVAWAGATALMSRRAPAVAAPLAGYGLTLVAAATLASDPALPRGPRLGALLFTVSDGAIVARRLLLRDARARRWAEGFVLATYAAAQYLLTAPRE